MNLIFFNLIVTTVLLAAGAKVHMVNAWSTNLSYSSFAYQRLSSKPKLQWCCVDVGALKRQSSPTPTPSLLHVTCCQCTNKDSSSSYEPPKFSNSFKEHMDSVRKDYERTSSTSSVGEDDGVDCTGEPSLDPSRMLMDDGLDSEYLYDFHQSSQHVHVDVDVDTHAD